MAKDILKRKNDAAIAQLTYEETVVELNRLRHIRNCNKRKHRIYIDKVQVRHEQLRKVIRLLNA